MASASPEVPAALGKDATSVPTKPNALISDLNPNETVSGQIKKLLEDDSPILQAAKSRAQQYSAGRGLQNSTMAAQAGETALIQTATPIASQDAQANAQRTSQNLQTVNQFGLNQQQSDLNTSSQKTLIQEQGSVNERLQTLGADQEIMRLREQGTINERLQTMDQNFRSIQSDLDRGAALTLEDKRFQTNQALVIAEYAQRAGLSSQEASQEITKLNQQHQNTLREINEQAKSSAAEMGPKLQAQYLASVTDRMNAASQEISGIYTTQGLKADQQKTAVDNARARLTSDLAQLQTYYSQSPIWDSQWGQDNSADAGQQPAPQPQIPGQVQIPQSPTDAGGWMGHYR